MTVTTDAGLSLTARPRLRPDLVLGPAVEQGRGVVHHIKDPRTGWFFRVGPREYFLMSQLDGRRSLADIGDAYRRRFGRRIDDRHWHQVLGMLASRRLLVGTDDPRSLAELAEAARRKDRESQRLLHYRVRLANPDRFFGWLHRRVRLLFSFRFVLSVLLAVAATAVLVAVNLGQLWQESRQLGEHGGAAAAVVAVMWAVLALHEAAHGLTCRHFGGSAPEIGVLWRFPLLTPYCKTDDVMLFGRRADRVWTAFAGVFVSLAALPPFAVLWLVSPQDSAGRTMAAAILVFGSIGALANLIPFLQLDGYYMLNHALGMANLRAESYRFWAAWLRRQASPADYSRKARWAYRIYGATSVVFGFGIFCAVMVLWFHQLRQWFSAQTSIVVIVGLLLSAVAGWVVVTRWLSPTLRRRRQRHP